MTDWLRQGGVPTNARAGCFSAFLVKTRTEGGGWGLARCRAGPGGSVSGKMAVKAGRHCPTPAHNLLP